MGARMRLLDLLVSAAIIGRRARVPTIARITAVPQPTADITKPLATAQQGMFAAWHGLQWLANSRQAASWRSAAVKRPLARAASGNGCSPTSYRRSAMRRTASGLRRAACAANAAIIRHQDRESGFRSAVKRWLARSAAPIAPNPAKMRVQVAGSGTPDVRPNCSLMSLYPAA